MLGLGETRLEAWVAARQLQVNGDAIQASKDRVRRMDTEDLERLWGRTWPADDVLDGIYLEHLHAELSRRGRGSAAAS